MKTRRTECTVECLDCKTTLVTVYAIEDEERPGIWSNVTMPKGASHTCPDCNHKGVRVLPSAEVAKVREELF